jgi:N-acetylglutamate synthase-like GNAT family acetyltransferase
MDDLRIRSVVDADSPALIGLISECWAEYPGCVLDVDAEEPWIRRPATYYADYGGQFWVVSGKYRSVVGCVGVRPISADKVELKSLYVEAAQRRAGLARSLVALVESAAIERGTRRIIVWSDSRFSNSHRFYERLGYWPTGQSRDLNDLSKTTEYGFAKEVLSSLFDFGDLSGTTERFGQLAAAQVGSQFGAIAATQQARAMGLSGDWQAARKLLESIDSADELVAGWIAIELGRIANSTNADGSGRVEFEYAFSAGKAIPDDGLAVDAAHMLAIIGSPAEQVLWSETGLELAEASVDPRARALVGALLNNLGCCLGEQNRWEVALAVHQRAVEWRSERAQQAPFEGARTKEALKSLAVARWQEARALRAVGRVEQALTIQLSLDVEADPYIAEERAECLDALGRTEEARQYFAMAAEGFGADDWFVQHEAARLARLKRLAADG